MDYDLILKRNRKSPILDVAANELIKLNYTQEAIKRILPHRDPLLLLDKLSAIDLTKGQETIIAERYIDPIDPIFKGHFPNHPVYPGCLQVEMAGQAGLALSHFMLGKTTEIDLKAIPSPVRATKVLGALFLEPIVPDQTVTILTKCLEFDGYLGKFLGQVMAQGKVTSVSIMEVFFLT